jgi:hypothetical protein
METEKEGLGGRGQRDTRTRNMIDGEAAEERFLEKTRDGDGWGHGQRTGGKVQPARRNSIDMEARGKKRARKEGITTDAE